MAANFHTAQSLTSLPTSSINFYNSQQTSPVNSVSATPTTVSPTSPRSTVALPHLPFQTRQLRPPKSPLYVPAVLRPTERPIRQSPLTPPRSVSSSFDSLNNEDSERTTSRRATGDSSMKFGLGRVVEHERIGSERLGKVTGLPTREHWKRDGDAPICDAATCEKSFNFFERRHHCRCCGNVFCNEHTPHSVPLDQFARFHPDGTYTRSCDFCWAAYKDWETARCSRSNSESSEGSSQTATTPTVGIGGVMAHGRMPGMLGAQDGQKVGSVAASVPRDWNWSTF